MMKITYLLGSGGLGKVLSAVLPPSAGAGSASRACPPVPFPVLAPGPPLAPPSEDGSVCGDPGDDWLHDPGLRGLSSSDDGTECGGWRRELGDDEVRENYMDAKFGGEDADMAEIMMG